MHTKSVRSIGCLALLLACCAASPLCSAQAQQDVAAARTADLPSAPVSQQRDASSSADGSGSGQNSAQQKPAPQNPGEPSLGDLGFSTAQTQADPKLQALLDRRTHMLKVHQKLGLYTLIPMTATLITGPMAKAKGRNGQPIQEPTSANLDFHAALGGVTAGMYFTTASYAIFAPKVPGVKHKGPIRLHEALAFIHGPGMIATPILGAMAYNQESNGEKVHGIAAAHGAVAVVTISAYAAALVAVSWPPKFLHRH